MYMHDALLVLYPPSKGKWIPVGERCNDIMQGVDHAKPIRITYGEEGLRMLLRGHMHIRMEVAPAVVTALTAAACASVTELMAVHIKPSDSLQGKDLLLELETGKRCAGARLLG